MVLQSVVVYGDPNHPVEHVPVPAALDVHSPHLVSEPAPIYATLETAPPTMASLTHVQYPPEYYPYYKGEM